MKTSTQVHLFGSLRKGLRGFKNLPVQLELETATTVDVILQSLEIDPEGVQLIMVNNKAVPKGSAIHPGDRLSLFPKEYPIFADWKDLRF